MSAGAATAFWDVEVNESEILHPESFLGTNTELHSDTSRESRILRRHPQGTADIESDPLGQDGQTRILSRLTELRREGETDEFGIQRATYHSYHTAMSLVSQAAEDFGADFPLGSASVDSEGGIRVTWFNVSLQVGLVCPAQPEASPFIYHESGSEYDLEERVGARALSHWLRWLNGQL